MTDVHAQGLVISVPWPLRLFGEYQDFLELPCVVMAADMRTAIVATPADGELSSITAPGLAKPLSVKLDASVNLPALPGFAAALRAVAAHGHPLAGAYDFRVVSNAPWFDRLPDSPALLVGWIAAFLALNGALDKFSGQELADIAIAARRDEPIFRRQIPELYATTLGGTLRMQPGDALQAKPLERNMPGIVIGSIPGSTGDSMAAPISEMLKALLALKQSGAAFDVRTSTLEEVVPLLQKISAAEAGLVYAQVRLRDICREAVETLEFEEGFDDDKLGELLEESQAVLGDYLGLRDERVEGFMAAAVGGGALGCKIIPGCASFIAFAGGRADEVLKAIRATGAHARLANATDGIRIEEHGCGCASH